MQRLEVCLGCDAEFCISHHLEPEVYRVQFCPFCGEEALEDESYEIDEEGHESDDFYEQRDDIEE